MPRKSYDTPGNERRQVNIAMDARKAMLFDALCDMKDVTRVQVFEGFMDKTIAQNADCLREDIAADVARSAAQLAVIDSLTSD